MIFLRFSKVEAFHIYLSKGRYTYQGVRYVRFSENLSCFIFLKHWFWDSYLCRQLRFLTSESIGKSLVNNILFESARCLVMAQIQFSSIKKNKDWTSRTLAIPNLSTSDNISVLHFFASTLPPRTPSQWTSYAYHP